MFHLEIYNRSASRIPKKIFLDLLQPAGFWLIKNRKIAFLAKHVKTFFVELNLVETCKMTYLNKIFRGKNAPTDVISLSHFEKNMQDGFIGEIFICVPVARKQAKKFKQTLKKELQFLFIHGLLHLFGYDHKKKAEENRMNGLCYKILFSGYRTVLGA